jgi:hypothetical protein
VPEITVTVSSKLEVGKPCPRTGRALARAP